MTRGREPSWSSQVFSTGCGGAGNIRSPSRDIQKALVNLGQTSHFIKHLTPDPRVEETASPKPLESVIPFPSLSHQVEQTHL